MSVIYLNGHSIINNLVRLYRVLCYKYPFPAHSCLQLAMYEEVRTIFMITTHTLRPRQMVIILQTAFSNTFSLMKIFAFWWNVNNFSQHGFKYWLGTVKAISHCLNQWWHRLQRYSCIDRPWWSDQCFSVCRSKKCSLYRKIMQSSCQPWSVCSCTERRCLFTYSLLQPCQFIWIKNTVCYLEMYM